MDMDRQLLDEALQTLGEVLEARRLTYEIVAIGGSALMLLGLVGRPTRDLDAIALVEDGGYISADPLPPPLMDAVVSVGRTLGLSDDWLNPGPTELLTAARWSRTHDPSDGYRDELVATLIMLGVEVSGADV